MAVTSYPFESLNTGTESAPVYDRAITAEDERLFNKLRYTNGVFAGVGEALAVTLNNGMSINVGTGGGHIEGALFYNTSAMVLTLEAPNSAVPNQNRIDRVVAQFNTSTNVRAVNIIVRAGTQAVNPVAPELRRESNLYEIALADIYVRNTDEEIFAENITDQRLNNELCGFVHPAMPGSIETSDLYKQYEASLQKWLDTVAAALDGSLAGQLMNRIGSVEERIDTIDGTIWPIDRGGTGAESRKDAFDSLTRIEPAELVGQEDTPDTWRAIGSGVISASWALNDESGSLGNKVNAPEAGIIINIVNGLSTVVQLLLCQNNIYIRARNISLSSEDRNKWTDWALASGEGYSYDITPQTGTWNFLRYREIGKKIIIEGRASSYKWSGSAGHVIGVLDDSIKPKINKAVYAHCSGQRIARVVASTAGDLVVDWITNIKDGSNYTTATWLYFRMEYYIED